MKTYAELSVESSPSGAEVYVDGKQVGVTPLASYRLSVGGQGASAELGIKLSGYEPRVFAVKDLARGRAISVPMVVLKKQGGDTPVPVTPGGEPKAGDVRKNPADGAEMVWIPAGEFQMGDRDLLDNPRHTVKLSGYWIYKNLVTVAQYKKYCKMTGRQMPGGPSFDSGWSQGDHPIVNVSWYDAAAYAKWAGCALPTEAQWENAARGTDGRTYPWGNDWDPSKCANSVGNRLSSTKPVGSYPSGASPYGCLDMAGNVWQWCRDWYDPWYCKSDRGLDPGGPDSGGGRVVRGGSWSYFSADCFRCAYRDYRAPDFRRNLVGFRCART